MISERLFHSRQKTSDFADGQSEISSLVPEGGYRINPIMDTLKARVNFLLEKRGLTQAEAARRGGFKNTAFINDIVQGKKLSVRGLNLLHLASALDTSTEYLLCQSEDPEPKPSQNFINAAREAAAHANMPARDARQDFSEDYEAPALDPGQFPREVPVRGVVACGDEGDFMFNGEEVEWVRRPPGLAHKKSVYALRVEGDSMLPAHKHGGLVYVDPHRRPGVGEDAVIELHPDDPSSGEPGMGFLKRLVRATNSEVTVEQYNPPRKLIFQRDDIKAFHRVIPWEEVLGI